MREFSRRQALKAGAAIGLIGALPQSALSSSATSSPDLEKYVQPLPVPETLEPDEVRDGRDYYELSITEFTQKLHPDLPETTVWGIKGSHPGPTIAAERGRPVELNVDNSGLPEEHLFEIDTRVDGTTPENHPGHDGPVPEVRSSIHPHGLKISPKHDGQADQWFAPDGTTGPRYSADNQILPNDQARMTSTYHDHVLGVTRLNAYAGVFGLYTITSEAERTLQLPDGEYDIPLILQDKLFGDDGSLQYPGEFESEFRGDTAVVNGAVWPYLEVEPRRYRFRMVNVANQRSFNLHLDGESGVDTPTMYQIAPDHGFLESVVPIGPQGEMDGLPVLPFERAEVIVDFSNHAGETFTLTNDAEFPYTGENSGPFFVDELMEIRVTDPQSAPDDPTTEPEALDLPTLPLYQFDEESARTTRHHTLDVETDDETGLREHLLNGFGFGDEEAIFEPHLGTSEVWELENTTPHAHSIHLHLVTFEVVGRGPDGTDEPDPNERGPKDTVRVGPEETVRIVPRFDGFAGRFPWHCHMLEHEDYSMMTPFRVVRAVTTYADSDGVVQTDGLRDAIDDWRAGKIDTDLLRDVITTWRSS